MTPLSLLTGVYGYVAALVLGLALGGSASYYVVHNANSAEISGLKLTASQTQTANVTASLTQLQNFIGQMKAADTDYNATLASINNNFAGINARIANVKSAAPLPVDCRPDTGRLSILTAATAAANAATPSPGK